jgi:hypothetical protein
MNRPTADGAHLSPTAAANHKPISPEAICRDLQRRYPGALVWVGRYTGEWWAFLPAGIWQRRRFPDRLLEARFAKELDQLLGRAWGLR